MPYRFRGENLKLRVMVTHVIWDLGLSERGKQRSPKWLELVDSRRSLSEGRSMSSIGDIGGYY